MEKNSLNLPHFTTDLQTLICSDYDTSSSIAIKKGDCTYHFGSVWVHCDFCRLLSNKREKWVKESSDHIDHYRNKKAKSIPFIISIFHPVYSKFVGESTWILFKRTINQCSIYIIKCERRIMWKISIYTWSYDLFKCSCNVVSLKSEVSCFATRS